MLLLWTPILLHYLNDIRRFLQLGLKPRDTTVGIGLQILSTLHQDSILDCQIIDVRLKNPNSHLS